MFCGETLFLWKKRDFPAPFPKKNLCKEKKEIIVGIWGAKLYDNDTALDIKGQFDDLRKGKTFEEITENLFQGYADELNNPEFSAVFWPALADIQWNLGRLSSEVKENALASLEKGGDLFVFRQEAPELLAKREKVLKELQQKLNSPQPPQKKIPQYRLYQCKWKIGDVFAYQFKSVYAKENGYFGKYVYFVKVDEEFWAPGHIIPLVYFYRKVDDTLSNLDALKTVGYVPQFYKPNAYQNNPDSKKLYLLGLLNTSSRVIPKEQLTYLGNIGEVARMDRENRNPYEVSWKRFDEYMIRNLNAWI